MSNTNLTLTLTDEDLIGILCDLARKRGVTLMEAASNAIVAASVEAGVKIVLNTEACASLARDLYDMSLTVGFREGEVERHGFSSILWATINKYRKGLSVNGIRIHSSDCLAESTYSQIRVAFTEICQLASTGLDDEEGGTYKYWHVNPDGTFKIKVSEYNCQSFHHDSADDDTDSDPINLGEDRSGSSSAESAAFGAIPDSYMPMTRSVIPPPLDDMEDDHPF